MYTGVRLPQSEFFSRVESGIRGVGIPAKCPCIVLKSLARLPSIYATSGILLVAEASNKRVIDFTYEGRSGPDAKEVINVPSNIARLDDFSED
tara:strand:- start:70 stop:348 length:279 start_codon:yes stop_codon:yes gene_type:complete